jgi:hypothetical protein
LLLTAAPALPAAAQDAGAIISVDTPIDAQTAELGQGVEFRGWAAHRDGAGTGVDRVVVLDAPVGAGGVPVVEATYGSARADVGIAYEADWTNSGFWASWRATGSTGNRTFWVYAHSPANDGWTNKTVTLRLIEATQPRPPMAEQYRDRWSSHGQGFMYEGMGMGPGYRLNPIGALPPIGLGIGPLLPPGTSVAGIQVGTLMPPLAVNVAGTTSNSVTLAWTPSLSPGVTNYQVAQSFSPIGPFTPVFYAPAGASAATVTGLNPNTTAYFQVSAVAAGMVSPPSPPVPVTTAP